MIFREKEKKKSQFGRGNLYFGNGLTLLNVRGQSRG